MPGLELEDATLSYDVEGSGEPVLLLHGQGSRRDHWELQVAALAPRYTTIRIDQRGHGDSSKPAGPYTMEQLAADAATVIRRVARNPTHVIGHSLGGAVALQLALDAPDLVRSLVVINAQACFAQPGAFVRLVMAGAELVPRLFGLRLHGNLIAAGYLPGAQLADRRAKFVEDWAQNDLRAYLATQRAVETFDVTARLGEIAAPMLVLGSDHDVLPTKNKQELAAKVKNGRLVMIEGSRHIALWDQPGAVNTALQEFLAGVS